MSKFGRLTGVLYNMIFNRFSGKGLVLLGAWMCSKFRFKMTVGLQKQWHQCPLTVIDLTMFFIFVHVVFKSQAVSVTCFKLQNIFFLLYQIKKYLYLIKDFHCHNITRTNIYFPIWITDYWLICINTLLIDEINKAPLKHIVASTFDAQWHIIVKNSMVLYHCGKHSILYNSSVVNTV
jgi:hypothetical protein